MKWIFYILLFFILACGEKKADTNESNSMQATEIGDTVITERKVIDTNLTVTNEDSIRFANFKIDSKLNLKEKVKMFKEKYAAYYSLQTDDIKMILPERYENIYFEKFSLRKKSPVKYGKIENIYPVADLYFFQFKDSTSCRNVLNNWLQCYGFDCTPVEFMKDLSAIKTTPSMAIINENEIIFLQYQCEHVGNNWKDFKSDLQGIFARHGSFYTLTLSDCGKKLKWENYYKLDVGAGIP